MPKAYWVATYRSVSKPEALAAYGKVAADALIAEGGKVLARGIPAATIEAGLKERTVLIEFESVDAAMAAYRAIA